jgi:DNA anti-recombination protein RmuC
MVRLGGLLRSADDSYQTAMQKLATGKGNLVRQVEQFRELGASVRKPFPKDLLDGPDDEPFESTPDLDDGPFELSSPESDDDDRYS